MLPFTTFFLLVLQLGTGQPYGQAFHSWHFACYLGRNDLSLASLHELRTSSAAATLASCSRLSEEDSWSTNRYLIPHRFSSPEASARIDLLSSLHPVGRACSSLENA